MTSDLIDESSPDLGHRPPLEPPPSPAPPAPSLALYAILLLAALGLIFLASQYGRLDRSALLLNLASNIIGAMIILIFVDRRLRKGEIRRISRAGHTIRSTLMLSLQPELRQMLPYAETLTTNLCGSLLPFYVPRPEVETRLLAGESGLTVFESPPGSGKTTLLQYLAWVQGTKYIRVPRHTMLPVIVTLSTLSDENIETAVHRTVRQFASPSDRVIARFLRTGRFLCLLDGLDEVFNRPLTLKKIIEFVHDFPGNSVILATRHIEKQRLENPKGFTQVTMPEMTHDQARDIIDRRVRRV